MTDAEFDAMVSQKRTATQAPAAPESDEEFEALLAKKRDEAKGKVLPGEPTISPAETFATEYAETFLPNATDEVGAAGQAALQSMAKGDEEPLSWTDRAVHVASGLLGPMAPVYSYLAKKVGAARDAEGQPLSAAELYRIARGENRRDRELGQRQNPDASKWGTGVGIAASVPIAVTGGARAIAATGAKTLPQMMAAGAKAAWKPGVAWGGTAGLGGSGADLTNPTPEDFVRAGVDTAVGGVVGGLTAPLVGAGLPVAGAVVKKTVAPVAGWLAGPVKEWAEEKAYKAAGPMLKHFRQVGDEESARAVGRTLLDTGAVRAFSTVKGVSQRLKSLSKEASKDVGESISALNSAQGGSRIAPAAIADEIDRTVIEPLRRQKTEASKALVKKLEAELENIRSRGGMTFEEAEALKRSFNPEANFSITTPNAERSAYRRLYGTIKGHNEAEARAVEALPGRPQGLADDFLAAKKKYEHLAPAQEAAADRVLRDDANNILSPSDKGFGATAFLATGNPIAAVATAATNKAVRAFGPSTAAAAYNSISKALLGLAKTQPDRLAEVVGPSAARALVAAAGRGENALAAAHFVMAQRDPEYLKRTQQLATTAP